MTNNTPKKGDGTMTADDIRNAFRKMSDNWDELTPVQRERMTQAAALFRNWNISTQQQRDVLAQAAASILHIND